MVQPMKVNDSVLRKQIINYGRVLALIGTLCGFILGVMFVEVIR